MSYIKNKLISSFLAIVSVLSIGTFGYWFIEKWSVLDALYMTVITLATVGFSETNPLSAQGRIFTIILILGGIGIMTYIFTTLASIVVEGHLKNVFRRRKMESRIKNLNNHYIICGATHIGLSVMDELKKTDKPLVVVVLTDEEYEEFSGKGFAVVKGDATNDDVLIKANIKNALGIFCALRNDKDNAFIALTAKGLNPSLKIISAQNEEGENIKNKLLRSGANIVVNPHFIGGLRMASEMIRPTVVNFLDHMLRGVKDKNVRFDEISLKSDSKIIGSNLDFVQKMDDALVVAIRNKNNEYEINPSVDRILEKEDIIVALGSVEQINSFKSKIN